MSKLALGTVQFGLDYGINNKTGQIPKKEVFKILDFASSNEIKLLDTAYNYGNSEKVIGEFLKQNRNNFKIISKLPNVKLEEVEIYFQKTLLNLSISSIYGYLLHDFNLFLENPSVLNKLIDLKKSKKIKKLGFSLYYPKDLEYLIKNNIGFDLVQVPFNIFDQRFAKYFPLLKDKKVEIHIRSVFLQGLFFKDPNTLPKKLIKAKSKLKIVQVLAKKLNVSVSSVCLNFALLNSFIDQAIIGVDKLDDLKENLANLKHRKLVKDIYKELEKLHIIDEQIILPVNWNEK
jgi:aryl-alcohol dehydrogenase-like predicted oxidoreductase